jgi:hypothetical protein
MSSLSHPIERRKSAHALQSRLSTLLVTIGYSLHFNQENGTFCPVWWT